jgi:hypothetical protein
VDVFGNREQFDVRYALLYRVAVNQRGRPQPNAFRRRDAAAVCGFAAGERSRNSLWLVASPPAVAFDAGRASKGSLILEGVAPMVVAGVSILLVPFCGATP